MPACPVMDPVISFWLAWLCGVLCGLLLARLIMTIALWERRP